MPLRHVTADLRRDLAAAASLREEFLAREFDRGFVAGGGRIIYAVDASLLHHIFPRERNEEPLTSHRKANIKRTRQTPYSESQYRIFSGPRGKVELGRKCSESETRLGNVISHYLIGSFSRSDDTGDAPPLLLLPGHDVEAYRLYDGIATAFRGQTERLSAAAAAAGELERLQRSIQSGRNETEKFNRVLEELFDIIYLIEQPHEQFHRFNRFLRDRRFVKLEDGANHKPYQSPELRLETGRHVFSSMVELARAFHDGDDEKPGLPAWWEDELRTQHVPRIYRENDAVALSALDLLNRILRPKKIRVVLFTLNQAIIEAGRTYFPCKADWQSGLEGMSFSDLYLRHPRSLLSERGLSRPMSGVHGDRGAVAEIESLLDAMLDFVIEDWRRFWKNPLVPSAAGRYGAWLDFRRAAKDEGLEAPVISDDELSAALEHNPSLHATFIERWTRYAARLSDNHTAASKMAERELKRSLVFGEGSQESVFGAIERIRNWVNRLTERSWSDFFNTAAETGLELVKVTSGPDVPIVWLAPQLVLRRKKKRRDSLSVLWTIDDVRRRTIELMESIGSVQSERSLSDAYVRALAYGVIFAAVNRWEVTRLLAQRAVQIAKTIIEEGGDYVEHGEQVDGREAYYLLAVASRVSGNQEAAAAALDEAKLRLLNTPSDSALSPVLTGLRFEAEALEQAAGALWSSRSSEDEGHPEAQVDAAVSTIERALALLGCDPCSEPAIQRQSNIAIRSALFTAVAVLALRDDLVPAQKALVELKTSVSNAVKEQRREISEAYADSLWLPLRDRALLQVAAAAAKVTLPREFLYTHRDVMALLGSTEASLNPRDRRRLANIESIAQRLNATP